LIKTHPSHHRLLFRYFETSLALLNGAIGRGTNMTAISTRTINHRLAVVISPDHTYPIALLPTKVLVLQSTEQIKSDERVCGE